MPGRITLLTDFGTADGYVAAMRGVLAARAPGCVVEDASHDVEPGDLHGGAWALSAYWDVYPPGTTHLVVVDPGVGGDRRAIVVEAGGRYGVGPDNGVLTPMFAGATSIREVQDRSLFRTPTSSTFHGRDVFAPVAAYLAGGGLAASLGPHVDDPLALQPPRLERGSDTATGEVVHVDRFGNLITSIPGDWLDVDIRVEIGGRVVARLAASYSAAVPGELAALVGSRGLLEVAIRDGHAARALGIGRGAEVTVRLKVEEG